MQTILDTPNLNEAMAEEVTITADPATIGHQGDVNFTCIGPVPEGTVFEEARLVVAEGKHGKHVLVGRVAVVSNGIAIDRAVLYHTDEPRARHKPIRFGSGVWPFWNHAEIEDGRIIRQRD